MTLGAFACLALAGTYSFGQINIGGGGGGDRGGDHGGARGNASGNAGQGVAKGEGTVKANVQGNGNGNKDNKSDNKPNTNNDNGNRRGPNSNGNANNIKNDNNKNDNDKNRDDKNRSDKNRDGVNIGGKDGINIDAGKGGIAVDSQRNKDRDNDRRDGDRRDNNDRRRDDLTKRGHMGDSDFDRFGIGRLDDNRYRNQSGNQWRYKRYGSDWFYWTPSGYWMYYGNNRWNRYDPDSYATYYYGDSGYVPQQAAVPANFNGPYYEDSNGFYYMNGNQRVYDPSIRRGANASVN